MGKCLVTKLKAKIERNDMPFLGTLRYYLESPDGAYPFFTTLGNYTFNGNIKFSFDDTANYFLSPTNGNLGSEKIFTNSTDDGGVRCRISKAGWISISPKYEFITIDSGYSKGWYCKAEEFKAMYNLTELAVENCMGDIKDFDINNNIIRLGLRAEESRGYREGMTYGDIANLVKYSKLQKLEISKTSIKGNIEDLYPLVETTEINITECKALFGDIKKLADKMYQAGRRSGTLKIWTSGAHGNNTENVTYNGEYFTNRVWTIVFSSDGHSDANTTS